MIFQLVTMKVWAVHLISMRRMKIEEGGALTWSEVDVV